ncbi:unnamed protein product [Cochlearia groenlandica]
MKKKEFREIGVVVVGKKVMVAVKASKEIPKAALLWTLTHVVQPGDRVRLLVVIPSNYTSLQAIVLQVMENFLQEQVRTRKMIFMSLVFR